MVKPHYHGFLLAVVQVQSRSRKLEAAHRIGHGLNSVLPAIATHVLPRQVTWPANWFVSSHFTRGA